jgi:hypothetical protein
VVTSNLPRGESEKSKKSVVFFTEKSICFIPTKTEIINPKIKPMKRKAMKKVIDIDVTTNPNVNDFNQLLIKVIGQKKLTNAKSSPALLSYRRVMETVRSGALQEMNSKMKISQSKFYHFYDENMKENIIQLSTGKLAVFSD